MYKIPTKRHYYTNINKYENKKYSQNGEDGVIDHIFKIIGFTNRIFVEFGFGIQENNSINLIVNHKCEGLFIDGNKYTCDMSKQIYKRITNNKIHFCNAFITKTNINALISRHYIGEIDFFLFPMILY